MRLYFSHNICYNNENKRVDCRALSVGGTGSCLPNERAFPAVRRSHPAYKKAKNDKTGIGIFPFSFLSSGGGEVFK